MIFHVLKFAGLSDDLKIIDALPDGNLERVGIHDTAERFSGALAISGLGQKIVIEGEKYALERIRPVETRDRDFLPCRLPGRSVRQCPAF